MLHGVQQLRGYVQQRRHNTVRLGGELLGTLDLDMEYSHVALCAHVPMQTKSLAAVAGNSDCQRGGRRLFHTWSDLVRVASAFVVKGATPRALPATAD